MPSVNPAEIEGLAGTVGRLHNALAQVEAQNGQLQEQLAKTLDTLREREAQIEELVRSNSHLVQAGGE